MDKIFKAAKRYIYIYLIFAKNCLAKQMEYRTNFFLMIAIETAFLFIKLLYTFVVYGTGVSISGFSTDSILLFTGTFLIMTGIYLSFFYFNFTNIQQYVSEGSLDMYITKPISLQFITTLRFIDIGTAIPNIIGGMITLIVGWRRMGIPVNIETISGYIGFIVSGVVISYSIMLAPQLLCFLIIKGNSLREITDSLWDFNSMPMNIYNKWMQGTGIFIFPIFLVSNFSPLFILGKLGRFNILWGIVAPIIFLMLVRFLWKLSIKNYCSASS